MTLDETLATLRKHGVQSAEVPYGDSMLRVVFEPTFAGPLPGEAPTPGGWKSPQTLDQDFPTKEVP